MIAQQDPALIENLESVWKALCDAPVTPDYILCSRSQYKAMRRFWRSKRKGKSTKTEITTFERDGLGIPEKSAPQTNVWWSGSHCIVDKRCLKRYRRRAAHGR